jgi:short/branched chain acyl-CoA dehydrogenase
MDFDLTDEQEAIRRLVREFAEGEVRPVAEELDRDKRFPYEIVEKLGKLGLMGIPYPEEYGGGGADNLAYALAIEELTRVDSSVAITVAAHTSLGTWPIYAFGSDAQKEEWLPRLCSGERLGAFGLTEPEAGSDAGNTRTRAAREDGHWVISGAKQFITNSGTDISGFVTITARTGEDEISNLLVPNGTPGYVIGEPYRKMGWNAWWARPGTASGNSSRRSMAAGSGFRRWAWAWRRGRSTRRSPTPRSGWRSGSRSRSTRRSRPSSPTWRPRSRRRAS